MYIRTMLCDRSTYIATRRSWRERFYDINPIGGRKDLITSVEGHLGAVINFWVWRFCATKICHSGDFAPLFFLILTKPNTARVRTIKHYNLYNAMFIFGVQKTKSELLQNLSQFLHYLTRSFCWTFLKETFQNFFFFWQFDIFLLSFGTRDMSSTT